MKRITISLVLSSLLVLLALAPAASPMPRLRVAEAATHNGALPTIDCAGLHFVEGASLTFDRDNTGTDQEYIEMVGRDGGGAQIMLIADQRNLGTTANFSATYPWAVAPASNPITVRLVSPAGGQQANEQLVWEVTGECSRLTPAPEVTEVVPGCDVQISLTSTAVVGAFVSNAPTGWAPGQLTAPLITLPAGKTAWVLGQDATHQYYKIVWVCTLLWVPVNTMGPNYDSVWNGAPLPTNVVK